MNKVALLFLLIVIVSCVKSPEINDDQKNYSITYNDNHLSSIEFGNNHKIKLDFYNNENLLRFRSFQNDTLNGKYYEFFENGFIKHIYNVKQGIQTGSNYDYYENGILKNYKFFDDLGKLAFIRRYDSIGIQKSDEGDIMIFIPDTIANKKGSHRLELNLASPPNCTHFTSISLLDSSGKIIEFHESDSSIIIFKYHHVENSVVNIECKLIDNERIHKQNFSVYNK